MTNNSNEKIKNLMLLSDKYKQAAAWVFAVIYLTLEPLLSQVVVIRSYSVVLIPYRIIRYASIILLIAAYIILLLRKRVDYKQGIIVPVLILFFCYFIPTIKYKCNYSVYLETMVPLLAYYILGVFVVSYFKCTKDFICIVSWFYLIAAVLNLVFKLNPALFQKLGMQEYESFISSIENLAGFPLVMGLFFNLSDEESTIGKCKLAVYLLVYFLSNYLMWTAAQVLGALLIALYLIPPARKILNKIDLSAWCVIAFLMFIVFVWFWKPIMNIPAIKFFIETVLKKDITFTGRLDIWEGVCRLIADSPVIGHGLMENPQNLYYDPGFNYYFVHAHNAFLQTMYEGGILTLLAVAVIMFFTSHKIRQLRPDEKTEGIVKIIIFVFLLNLEMDQFFIYPWRSCLWCMICFLCNYIVLVGQNEH